MSSSSDESPPCVLRSSSHKSNNPLPKAPTLRLGVVAASRKIAWTDFRLNVDVADGTDARRAFLSSNTDEIERFTAPIGVHPLRTYRTLDAVRIEIVWQAAHWDLPFRDCLPRQCQQHSVEQAVFFAVLGIEGGKRALARRRKSGPRSVSALSIVRSAFDLPAD